MIACVGDPMGTCVLSVLLGDDRLCWRSHKYLKVGGLGGMTVRVVEPLIHHVIRGRPRSFLECDKWNVFGYMHLLC